MSTISPYFKKLLSIMAGKEIPVYRVALKSSGPATFKLTSGEKDWTPISKRVDFFGDGTHNRPFQHRAWTHSQCLALLELWYFFRPKKQG